ncbi:DUF2889 domain-containing protein [Rhodococcus oxybenzonivorans]|uniref:DUF2889 domain-containing protein n=1 Tax=Rhodococcus oxybenzonivorans TaxID=1990687 RepID=UPI002954016B|nr:DUF2889 domain-containing protein [Rhodococcus oxybenzonivorans]MDV7352740.1 DUF2889 domain-containing protein [Rhodococcus oxybenzonivorans]
MSENSWVLRRGVHNPTTSTPVRLPYSVRRTTSIDILRPDGPGGLLLLRGSGRDLGTDGDGSPVQFDAVHTGVDIDFGAGRTLVAADAGPGAPDLSALIGARAASGFRSALAAELPGDASQHSLLYRVLDDVPVATVISGYALTREDPAGAAAAQSGQRPGAATRADYCAGFATGGVYIGGIEANGTSPVVMGPPAPELVRGHDPAAWHRMADLPPKSMRRVRRIDIHGESEVTVDAMFRDSYVDEHGAETVVHEYLLDLTARGDTFEIVRAVATPRVLPWPECTGAVAAVARLVGRTVSDVAPLVGAEFRGVGSCTHLNDLLRSVTDVVALSTKLTSLN